ncbi:DUF4132 domain-containing protein [Embleya sp. NPDC020630]|uniref:DUF4132 domain-containing protein n=1 Tax=Embleya sp. NPDC020630 TaxID=3363979 RepID=UPI0037A746C9
MPAEVGVDAATAAILRWLAQVGRPRTPGHGLTEVGRRVERFGEATAELIVSGRTVTIAWRNAAGRVVKSPPADVRRDHGVALGELKADAKDIAKMLAAQSGRLDRLFLARRSCRFDRWRAQFLDHPRGNPRAAPAVDRRRPHMWVRRRRAAYAR